MINFMKPYIILMLVLAIGCSTPITQSESYKLDEKQKYWISYFYGNHAKEIKNLIYYAEMSDDKSAYYKDGIIYVNPNRFNTSVILHEIMHYYQEKVLSEPYDNISWYGLSISDIAKEKLGSEQEARAVEWTYWFISKDDNGWKWTKDELEILNYLVPYLQSRGLLTSFNFENQ